jgi:hypothetical protein
MGERGKGGGTAALVWLLVDYGAGINLRRQRARQVRRRLN